MFRIWSQQVKQEQQEKLRKHFAYHFAKYFEVLIIINFGRKESQMVDVLVQSSHKLLIQRSRALHGLGITLDCTVSTSIFLHMGIHCFCKTFSLPQHFFFWYGMHCTDEDATKGPSIYYVRIMDWLGGFRKCQFLLTFSTAFILTQYVGGSKQSKNVLTYYMDGP